MPGDAPDPVLVDARRALLDALEALRGQLDYIVLVGPQTIYVRTDEITLGVALFTKDADLAILPPLAREPNIERERCGTLVSVREASPECSWTRRVRWTSWSQRDLRRQMAGELHAVEGHGRGEE